VVVADDASTWSVFVHGGDDGIYRQRSSGGGWVQVAPGGSLAGDPTPVADGSGRVWVFWRTLSNTLSWRQVGPGPLGAISVIAGTYDSNVGAAARP
jgi:hypothetical protein